MTPSTVTRGGEFGPSDDTLVQVAPPSVVRKMPDVPGPTSAEFTRYVCASMTSGLVEWPVPDGKFRPTLTHDLPASTDFHTARACSCPPTRSVLRAGSE